MSSTSPARSTSPWRPTAAAPLSEPVLARALCHVDNAYFVPYVHVNGRVARSTRGPRLRSAASAARRACSSSRTCSIVAPLLRVAAATLHRRNFYTEGQTTPYARWCATRKARARMGAPARVRRHRGPHRAGRALERRPRAPQARPRPDAGEARISFDFTAFDQAGALVHVHEDGSVLVTHGATEMSQGLHSKMLQVAATALAVPSRRCGWLPLARTRPRTRRRTTCTRPTRSSACSRHATPASPCSTSKLGTGQRALPARTPAAARRPRRPLVGRSRSGGRVVRRDPVGTTVRP